MPSFFSCSARRSNKIQILAELTKLRQLCCDPALLFEDYKGESAKVQMCMDLIGNAVHGGHKVRFNPVPPAFKEMQNTGTSSLLKLSTICIRFSLLTEPVSM